MLDREERRYAPLGAYRFFFCVPALRGGVFSRGCCGNDLTEMRFFDIIIQNNRFLKNAHGALFLCGEGARQVLELQGPFFRR